MFTRFRLSKVSLPFTKLSRHRRQKDRTQLRFERLEDRRLLAATDLGAIEGRVFVDLNASGDFNNGEQVDGAAVQLFLDNGTTPGVFDVGDTEQTLLGSPDTTDTNGLYRFDGLSSGNYFVVQPLQMVGSRTLNLEVRGPIAVSGVGVAGTTTIDTFATNQSLIEDLVVDSNSVSAFHDVGAEVIGTERDVEVNLQTAGAADARVLSNELLFGLSGNATADFTVVYDGNDGATAVNTSGLSTDLTDGATNTHFTITIDAQVAGDSATLTVQNATLTATETFMLNAGTSTYCLAFDAFSGDTSVFQNVGAITLAIDGNQINNDYDISNFATLQPDVETQDFLNNGVADLRLTKTVDNSSPILGQNVTFTITLTNDGIDGATNVLVRDQLPAGLTYVSDNPSQGTYDDMMGVWNVGNLSDTGVATLEIVATVNSTGGITNIAQVSASDQDDTDSTPDNNEGSEDDQDEATLMAPVADLRLTKTVDNATPNVGDNVTFTVSVTNDGPNSATSVEVRDLLPAGLTYVSDNPSQGTYDDGTGIWTIGNMFSGDTDTLDITATVTSASA
ncbi:MAG TPA: hypothetical protein VMX74_14460, partial [Pirellulales bacterium]|nr:hypothetical protein [Pirellulales bacterium]